MPIEQLSLVEPVPIDDDLCSGLALVDRAPVGARLVFFEEQTCYESGASMDVIKRKIVVPVEALRTTMATMARFLAQRGDPLRLVE